MLPILRFVPNPIFISREILTIGMVKEVFPKTIGRHKKSPIGGDGVKVFKLFYCWLDVRGFQDEQVSVCYLKSTFRDSAEGNTTRFGLDSGE